MKKILLLTITLLVTHGSTFSLASPVQTNNPGLNGPMQKMPLNLTISQADQDEAEMRPDGSRNECNLLCDVWYPYNWTGPMFTVSLFFSIYDCVIFAIIFIFFSPCRQLPAVQNVLFAHQVEDDITFTNRACIILKYAIASLISSYRFIVYRHIPPN